MAAGQGEMPEALKALEAGLAAAESEQAAAAATASKNVTVLITVPSDAGGNTPCRLAGRSVGKLGDRAPFRKPPSPSPARLARPPRSTGGGARPTAATAPCLWRARIHS